MTSKALLYFQLLKNYVQYTKNPFKMQFDYIIEE